MYITHGYGVHKPLTEAFGFLNFDPYSGTGRYWTREPRLSNIDVLIMPAAVQRVMHFHLGTAIAGSALLPSIDMVKLLLATVPRKRNVCRRAAFWKTAFVYVQVLTFVKTYVSK
jgi:hypothetical protein